MYRPLHVFCFHAMLLPKIPHYRISIIRKERHAGLPLILAARNAARRSAAHNVHLHAARCGAARRAARRRCNGAADPCGVFLLARRQYDPRTVRHSLRPPPFPLGAHTYPQARALRFNA